MLRCLPLTAFSQRSFHINCSYMVCGTAVLRLPCCDAAGNATMAPRAAWIRAVTTSSLLQCNCGYVAAISCRGYVAAVFPSLSVLLRPRLLSSGAAVAASCVQLQSLHDSRRAA
jgi:hypothetical protein